MNQWSFVIAAYLAVAITIAGLIACSWAAMRQAERNWMNRPTDEA
jgi:hypothetical protein